MGKLIVIQGTKPQDTPKQRAVDRVKTMPKPAAMLQCPRCGAREVTETRLGAVLKNGKVQGGTKQYLCTCCLLKGERVVVK